MIDIHDIPDIAKHQVEVLADAIHPIATDPRVKSARRSMAKTIRRAKGTVHPSSRPSTWTWLLGAALLAGVAYVAYTMWSRRGRDAASTTSADEETAGFRDASKDSAKTNGRQKKTAQPAA